MLSKKMAFSLMSLITILAIAFIAPTAMGAVLGENFKTTISLLGTGSDLASVAVLGDNVTGSGQPFIKVVFDKAVADGEASTGTVGAGFDFDDLTIVAFNKATGDAVTISSGDPTPVPGTMTEFTVALGSTTVDDSTNTGGVVVLVTIAAGAVTNNDPADVITAGTGADTLGMNKEGSLKFDIVAALSNDTPRVVSVTELPLIVLGPGSDDAFTFIVTLSEKPKEFKKDHIDAANATVDGDPIALPAQTESAADVSTVASNMVYPYLVTVKPKYESKDDIVIKIKSFDDTDTPVMKSQVSTPYRVKVNSDANKKVGQSGTEKNLPKDVIVPANGYLVVAKNTGNPKSEILGMPSTVQRILPVGRMPKTRPIT